MRPSDGERGSAAIEFALVPFGAAPAARARADRRARPRSAGPDAGLARRGARRRSTRPSRRSTRRSEARRWASTETAFGSRSIERARGVRRSRSPGLRGADRGDACRMAVPRVGHDAGERDDAPGVRLTDDRGSVSIVVAASVAIVLVMAMAAADVACPRGRSSCQTSADAAALAAAQTLALALPDDVLPRSAPREYAARNGRAGIVRLRAGNVRGEGRRADGGRGPAPVRGTVGRWSRVPRRGGPSLDLTEVTEDIRRAATSGTGCTMLDHGDAPGDREAGPARVPGNHRLHPGQTGPALFGPDRPDVLDRRLRRPPGADPRRQARGEQTRRDCPVCRKDKLRLVTYVYGDGLRHDNGACGRSTSASRWPPTGPDRGATWSRCARPASGTTCTKPSSPAPSDPPPVSRELHGRFRWSCTG